MSGMTTFQISVNGGPTQDISVATGYYVSAAAAVPAIMGIHDFPVEVKIWLDSLQPDYPPLTFAIAEAGGAARLAIEPRKVA